MAYLCVNECGNEAMFDENICEYCFNLLGQSANKYTIDTLQPANYTKILQDFLKTNPFHDLFKPK